MPRTEKTLTDKYKPYLIKLASFKEGTQYELDHNFTNKELGDITPAVIVGFGVGVAINFKAYPAYNYSWFCISKLFVRKIMI